MATTGGNRMSGGHFDYSTDRACNEMFDWISADYGLGDKSYQESVKAARALNPCQDKMFSEMVYDMFCVLHSLDWYVSGDTGEDQYRKDLAYFKAKWLGTPVNDIIQKDIDVACAELREELRKTLIWEVDNGGSDNHG